MGRWIALIVSLALGFALAWRAEQTPDPRPADAPAAAFSAGRALRDVEVIARAPHPIGTPANLAVRDHLLRRMSELGLGPQVQRADAFTSHASGDVLMVAGGSVENLVGLLRGRDPAAPALVLMAHYDSVPASPGAGDDATGVAAALEVVRALRTGPPPARDVIVLLTDGEEAGLLGAEAFFGQHPLARRAGFVINMEARGGGGRVQMFQTGAQNGQVVELFRRAAVKPVSSSLAVFLYEHMPNDTDFTVSSRTGAPGLNFAFIGRQFEYHMASSTPANLDKGSLQHMGDQVLAAAREAAYAPALPAKAPDVVYASTFGSHMAVYAPQTGWAVLALAGVLTAFGVWRARRIIVWKDVLKGLGAAVYLLAGGAALLRLARRAALEGERGFLEQYYLLAQVERWELAVALVALGALLYTAAAAGRGRARPQAAGLALAAGLACSAFGGWDPVGLGLGGAAALAAAVTFGRPAGLAGAWAGLLITGFAAAIAAQVLAPTTAFLVAWPLALGAAGAAVSGLGTWRSWPILALLAGFSVVGLTWTLGFAHGVFQGLDMPELLTMLAWLIALFLWPLAQPEEDERRTRRTAFAILVVGALAVAGVRLDTPWSPRHPRPTSVAYLVEPAAGRAWRASFTNGLDDWTRQVLTADGGKIAEHKPPGYLRALTAAPARPTPAADPQLALAPQAQGGGLSLRLVPPQGARVFSLILKPTVQLKDLSINGAASGLDVDPAVPFRLRWHAAPAGVELGFEPAAKGSVSVEYAVVTEAWPGQATPLPPRPPEAMPFDLSDSTVVVGRRRLAW